MKVCIENNPVTNRIWNEWLKLDEELSGMSKEKRLKLCEGYQWLYPKETKRFVELESLYSSVHRRSNREEFHKWFYVVCGHILSRVHLGENSYFIYLSKFKKLFQREKCTSKDFPKQVLLVLGLLGYITKLDRWYIYNKGSDKNCGYHFIIDKEKLVSWDYPSEGSVSFWGMPEWVMTKTSSISFEEPGKDINRLSWALHPDWLSERQYESIASVEVLEEGIGTSSRWMFDFKNYQYYYHLPEDKQKELKKKWSSYVKLRNLSLKIIGGCIDDSDKPDGKGYAGRFHTIMTNMRSEDRHQFLRLDGELITEVDVSSAQPTFLGIMMYKETGVMSEWLRQCLSGHFYEWIQEKTNTPEEVERKTIKIWMMRYLYSCYQPNVKKDYGKTHKPFKPTKKQMEKDGAYLEFEHNLHTFLKKEEPVIYKVIDCYKRNPVYREDKIIYKVYPDDQGKDKKKKVGQGKWCSKLSYDLVKMEVEYIKRCIHSLPEDMKFWTIHDCICSKESDSMFLKSIMEKVSREMYGEDITLMLKRENTSAEIS